MWLVSFETKTNKLFRKDNGVLALRHRDVNLAQ